MKKKLFGILLLLLPISLSFSVGPDFFEPVLDNILSHDISQINFTIITFEYHFSFMPAKTFNISRIKKYGIDPQWEDIKDGIKNNAYNNQYPFYKEYIENVILNADARGATPALTKIYPSEDNEKGIAEYRICSRQSSPYDNLVIITEGFDSDETFSFNKMIEEMERDWVDRKDDDAEIYEKIWIVPPDGEIPSSRGRLNLFTRL